MPVYEYSCDNSECRSAGTVLESYLRRSSDPDPDCPSCKGSLRRLISIAHGIFVKPYGRYCGGTEDGIWVTRTKSTRHVDGTPEKQYVTSMSEVREYCKSEGLALPTDYNPSAEISKDGKTLTTNHGKSRWI